MSRNRRRWCAMFGGLCMVSLAGLAGVVGAAGASADDADNAGMLSNILGQADTNMTKAADALSGIPTDSLSSSAASSLSGEQSFDAWAQSAIHSAESLQGSLSAAATDSARLIGVDKSLLVDTTQVLAGDQTAAADPASAFGNGINVGMLLNDVSVAAGIFNVDIAGIEAKFLDTLGLSDLL